MRTKEKKWAQALLYGMMILLISSIPGRQIRRTGLTPYINDKVVHGVMYTGAGVVVRRVVPEFWLAGTVASAWGGLDENYQRLTPGRDCSMDDWMADLYGSFFGAYLYVLLRRFRSSKKADA